MRFSAQAYSFPKEPEFSRDWEDSAACSVRNGRFAVADGASEAYRSGEWAETLTEAYIAAFPALDGPSGPQRQKVIRQWFAALVRVWHGREVPAAASPWWAKDAEQERPPSATFAGLQLTPYDDDATWEATAIGDSCIFHIRRGCLEMSFPLTSPGQFNRSPHLLTTAPGRLDGSLAALGSRTGQALPGDIFVLATDAASKWLLSLGEYDQETWGRVGFFGPREFTQMMTELRAADAIDADDVAVVVVVVHT
jgi:Protein phosphatase 2C